MKTTLRNKIDSTWNQYWEEATSEFFKVEAVQDYGAEENVQSLSFKAWKNGDKKLSIRMIMENANLWSKQTSEKHILKRRVHIVKEPYTPYLEWEIMHYKLVNIPMGKEKVYLIKYGDLGDNLIPGDFMIFDDERVANSHYDKSGKMISMDFYNRGEDISEFLSLKDLLLTKATELKIS